MLIQHPVQLLPPLDGDEALEVVPGADMGPLGAAGWLTDDDMAIVPVWKSRSPKAADTPRVLRPGSSPLTIMRQVRSVTSSLAAHERALTGEKYREAAGATDTYHNNSVAFLALRLLYLLEALRVLGYTRPDLPGAIAIMALHRLPVTLAEWDRPEDGAEEEPDGAGT